MFTGGLSAWHILIVVVAAIVLFGYKRLPDAARSIGRSARIFKAETQGLLGDDKPQQVESAEATQLQDQAAQLRAQAAKLEEAAKAAESQAAQAPKTT